MKETKSKESTIRKTHVSEVKHKEVETLRSLFSEYDTIALVDLTSLPSPQLQIMRSKLKKDNVVVRVTKKRLIKKALENFKGKKGIEEFVPFLDNVMPALIFSRLNSFKLSLFLRKNKSKVAAKPGQTAPKDLVVNAGPTSFAPGPMIGELGSLGVKAVVEQGKIVIKKDTVVVKKGEVGVVFDSKGNSHIIMNDGTTVNINGYDFTGFKEGVTIDLNGNKAKVNGAATIKGKGLDAKLMTAESKADITFDKRAANLLGHGFPFVGLHVGNHHRAALAGEHAGRAFAQARGATGDNEYFACNFHEVLQKMVDVNVNVNYGASNRCEFSAP